MSTVAIVVLSIVGVFVLYAVVAPFAMNLGRFVGRRWLYCPTRAEYGLVRLNAAGAALKAGYGKPDPHVVECSIRNPGTQCPENCLHGAQL